MKLWILEKQKQLPKGNPWDPWFDRIFRFVVRADTEEQARALAQANGREELRDGTANPWLDSSLSTCEELSADGESKIIIEDFRQS